MLALVGSALMLAAIAIGGLRGWMNGPSFHDGLVGGFVMAGVMFLLLAATILATLIDRWNSRRRG